MLVQDAFTSEVFCRQFCEWLSGQTLLFGWKATKESPGAFWHRNYVLTRDFKNHYDPNAIQNELTFQRLMEESHPLAQVAHSVSTQFFKGQPLTRVWVNVQAFGDEATIHHDFPMIYRGKARTVIWYPVEKWDADWGGDFVLFDDHREILDACVVKPDRVVSFDGSMFHAARPISRYTPSLRISVAFGLEDF